MYTMYMYTMYMYTMYMNMYTMICMICIQVCILFHLTEETQISTMSTIKQHCFVL